MPLSTFSTALRWGVTFLEDAQICADRLPVPDATRINVNELFIRVIADSTSAGRTGGIAQIRKLYATKTDIDGFALHVQAVLGDATVSCATQRCVRGRTTVAGNDLKRLVTTKGQLEIVQEVEEFRVHPADTTRIVVTQEMAEGGKRFRDVIVADGVSDFESLAGMRVGELQRA